MKKIIILSLIILAINAVLIQTITSELVMLKNIIRISILLLVVFGILFSRKPISILLFILTIISIISLMIGRNTDQLTYIFIFIFIQGLLIVKTNKIEKYFLISSILSFSLIFIFLFLGITQNEVFEYRNRMTFGTKGVPFLYNLVFGTFSLLVIYFMKYSKKTIFQILIALLSLGATTYFYIMTDIRGGYLSFIAFLIFLVIVPLTNKIFLIRYFVALTPVVSLFVALIIASFNNNLYVNEILSNRPVLINNFLSNLSINDLLFSTSVKAYDTRMDIVDNSYLHLLIGGGIILSCFFLYIFFRAIVNLYKEEKYIEISFIIATCIYFNIESIMVRIENIFIIYFWYLLIKYSLYKPKNETILNDSAQLSKEEEKKKKIKRYKVVW